MCAKREFVDWCTFASQVENANLKDELIVTLERFAWAYLGVGHTAVVPRLGVRLVLAVAVAASGTATHFD